MKNRLDDIDQVIRDGRLAEARRQVTSLAEKPPKGIDRARLASLAARVGVPELGLRILRKHRTKPVEIAEHALCLIRVGAVDEAKEGLKKVDLRKVPQAELYLALADMAYWDYDKAIPRLERYLETQALSDYSRRVGRVNLVAVLISERHFQRANGLIDELRKECEAGKNTLLLSNVYELSAVSAIYEKRYAVAKKLLDEADARFSNQAAVDTFFFAKWKAILSFALGDRKPLLAFRGVAEDRPHWETIRECDRFEAVLGADRELFLKVYFGTPYRRYREWLTTDTGGTVTLPEIHRWNLKGVAEPVDLLWGTSKQGLPVGQALHRVLATLCSDFYRPFRIASLHEKLFPGEAFNPDSSPKRVHASIARLRKWLEKQSIPLGISEDNNLYSLTSMEPFALKVKALSLKNEPSVALTLLKQGAGETRFTATWASEKISVPLRSMIRILGEGVDEGELEKSGKGRATRYRFVA